MRHAWRGYKQRAWGKDEVKPKTGTFKTWCNAAITMLDSLSTLWLMDLHEDFDEAAEWLAKNPLPSPGGHGLHSLFEVNIRGLAGVLSAFHLSGKAVFLDTARRLGDALMPGFRNPNGLPTPRVDLGTGEVAWHTWVKHALLAEAGSIQLEFRDLSHATGDPKYQEVADKAMSALLAASGTNGLVPIYINKDSDPLTFANTKVSFGAMGDSYYEYMLKQWLQSGKREPHFKEAWKRSMKDMFRDLVQQTKGGLTYVAEMEHNKVRQRMDHLTCFVGGMLILGARTLPADEVDPAWELTAEEVTKTCFEMYRRTSTGLSPEYVNFNQNSRSEDMSVPNDAPHNLLRPEALESIYYMHYYTGDPKYRQWGYQIFKAFVKHSKVNFGFSAIKDVRSAKITHSDSMESFFLAETLKYLFLLFAPRSKLNLEEFVLNTEAHPLPVWT